MQTIISDQLVAYEEALAFMDRRVDAIRKDGAEECLWLLEHPPVYTAGTSAIDADLKTPDRFPVISAGRGGGYVYHGPGQRVAYVMADLSRRRRDVRRYVWLLEEWAIRALAEFGVVGERRTGRVGVWVVIPTRQPGPDGEPHEAKIAAIGVRIRRWVAFHGISVNVEPDLSHYDGIVPCGIAEYGITSLVDLGVPAAMADLDAALLKHFGELFGLETSSAG